MNVSRHLYKIAVFMGAAVIAGTSAFADVRLASHRAVYDLTYVDSKENSSVIDVKGRIVFEMVGSSCEGYTVNMRIVTDLSYKGGKSGLTDTSMRNWEAYDGNSFVFDTISRTNSKTTEENRGSAERGPDMSVVVDLVQPKKMQANLGANTVFPSDHLKLLIAAARKNQRIVVKKLFDGSEDGVTPFDTSAFIGNPIPPEDIKDKTDISDIERLRGLESWPVTLSYFKKDTAGEDVPDYEVNFRLYANGISTHLIFDYGDFVMAGPLKSLEFLKETPCE